MFTHPFWIMIILMCLGLLAGITVVAIALVKLFRSRDTFSHVLTMSIGVVIIVTNMFGIYITGVLLFY